MVGDSCEASQALTTATHVCVCARLFTRKMVWFGSNSNSNGEFDVMTSAAVG